MTISTNLLFRLETGDFIFGCVGGGGQQLERDWTGLDTQLLPTCW